MEKSAILRMVDHTLLAPTATPEEIIQVVEDGIKYNVATICICNGYVRLAAEHAKGRLKIAALAGFPLGWSTTATKCFEAAKAFEDGADEIDMVASIGLLRAGRYDEVLEDIKAVKRVCGDRILKVIIETCLLTEDEKIKMCQIVSESGADFIKTSTGFSTGGATREDIALFKAHCRPGLGIKAAGGIRSFKDAEDMIALGATRLGTSSLVKIMKNEELSNY